MQGFLKDMSICNDNNDLGMAVGVAVTAWDGAEETTQHKDFEILR